MSDSQSTRLWLWECHGGHESILTDEEHQADFGGIDLCWCLEARRTIALLPRSAPWVRAAAGTRQRY